MSTIEPLRRSAQKPAGRKQAQAEATRRKLLDAAQALIAERGFPGTSAQAVQERSGVSRGSIFWHFNSMEGLRNAALEDGMEQWLGAVIPDKADGDAGDFMGGIVSAHLNFLGTSSAVVRMFYVLLADAMAEDGALRALYRAFWDKAYAAMEQRLRAAIAAGSAPADLDPAAVIAVAGPAIIGIHIQHMVSPDLVDLEETHRALARFLSRSFAAPA